jgi:hypothetical protein
MPLRRQGPGSITAGSPTQPHTHTNRSQEAVSTAKTKASHPHRGVMYGDGFARIGSEKLATTHRPGTPMQLSHQEPHIMRCTVHSRDPCRYYRTGSCASMTSTTAADLPGRRKPVKEQWQEGRRNEIMSVLWIAMIDTLTMRYGKPGNSGSRPEPRQHPGPTRPQRGSDPHCRLPRQPPAHTQGAHCSKISTRSTPHHLHLSKWVACVGGLATGGNDIIDRRSRDLALVCKHGLVCSTLQDWRCRP